MNEKEIQIFDSRKDRDSLSETLDSAAYRLKTEMYANAAMIYAYLRAAFLLDSVTMEELDDGRFVFVVTRDNGKKRYQLTVTQNRVAKGEGIPPENMEEAASRIASRMIDLISSADDRERNNP